jgi:glycosyltransferase involved in cell wall biosynthesis
MRWSDAVVTVSAFTRDEVVALYGIPPSKITVAPNGVDPVFFDRSPRPSPVDPPFFLAVGNLQPRKNLVTLIRAYRRLLERRPRLPERLVIVGKEFFQADALYAEADEMRRHGRIEFTGFVPDDQLVGLLQRATAFAYPSVYEGFGLPVVEAMAAGTPALASDIPVMHEVAGDAALLSSAADADAWADALERVATDPALRRSLVERGTARAARFTWDASARAVLETLERASRRRRPRP